MAPFLEILEIVLPVFLVIALGYALRRRGLLSPEFLLPANRLVYYVCLPLLLFYKIGSADFLASFDGALVLGSAATVVLGFVISSGFGRLRGYAPARRGAFSQGSFRGNLAYVGLPICYYAFGEEGLTRGGILMGFLVPVLNFFAILALLLPHRHAAADRGAAFWLRRVALNPLIIASCAGTAWSFSGLRLPTVADRVLDIVTGMTLPLALLTIGGGFSLRQLRGDLLRAGLATGLKLVGLPLIAAVVLRLLGVSGLSLGIGVIMAGTPAASASYIMAHEMHGDAELAASIVMLSTLLSAATYTVALFILHGWGL